MDTNPKNNLLNLVQDALNTTSTSSALVVQTSLTTTTIYDQGLFGYKLKVLLST